MGKRPQSQRRQGPRSPQGRRHRGRDEGAPRPGSGGGRRGQLCKGPTCHVVVTRTSDPLALDLRLCGLGQTASLLCASVSPTIKEGWG